MSYCVIESKLPPNEKQVWDYMKTASKAMAYHILNSNNQKIPSSIEEAKLFIEAYKQKQIHKKNLYQAPTIENFRIQLSEAADKIVKEGEVFFYSDTKKQLQRVSDILEQMKKRAGYYNKAGGDNFNALKGTVIHSYLQEIAENILRGNKVAILPIRQKVIDTLKIHPDFKDKKNSFFELTNPQFNALVSGVNEIKKELDRIQSKIDPNKSYEIWTEQLVLDPSRDTVGTIDLLVMFSDGSVAKYDYKTKSFPKKGKKISTGVRTNWINQSANYSNILRNNYGITQIRLDRVLPIEVDFSKKLDDGTWTNKYEQGFSQITINNENIQKDYLKPIPFGERKGDMAFDALLNTLENRRFNLVKMQTNEASGTEKIRIGRQIASLDATLSDLYLAQDVNAAIARIKQIESFYKDRLHLDPTDAEGLSFPELIEAYEEIAVYTQINESFGSDLLKSKNPEEAARIKAKLKMLGQSLTEFQRQLEYKMYELSNNDMLLYSGQDVGKWAQKFSGPDAINIPVINHFNNIHTQFMDRSRKDSEVTYTVWETTYQKAVEWGKQNGLSHQGVMDLFIDDNSNFVLEYKDEFYQKFRDLTKKYRKDNTSLTTQEKKWLQDNWEVDTDAWNRWQEAAKKGQALLVKKDPSKKEDAEKSIEAMYEYTDPTKTENFYKGNTKPDVDLIIPKKNRTQEYSAKYNRIQSNPALLAYYNLIKDFVKEEQIYYGKSRIGDNFLPNIFKSEDEMVKDGSIFNLKKTRDRYLNKIKYRGADDVLGSTDVNSGEIIKTIPLLYVDNFNIEFEDSDRARIEKEVEIEIGRDSVNFQEQVNNRIAEWFAEQRSSLKSRNIQRSFLKYIEASNDHKARQAMKHQVEALGFLLKSDLYQQKTKDKEDKIAFDGQIGQIAVISGADPKIIEMFNIFKDRLLYGQSFKNDYRVFDKYSLNKISKAASTYVSANYVGLHVVLMASNYLTARNNFKKMAKQNRLYSTESADNALKWFGKKDDTTVKIFQYLQPTNRNLLSERADDSTTFASKWMRLKTLFWGHMKGDEKMDILIATSMANTWVLDSDGVIKNPLTDRNIINPEAKKISELIVEVGDAEYDIKGLSDEEYSAFRRKIRKAANEIKGMATENQKGTIYAGLEGAQLMLLRSWMPGMAQARFKTLQFDLTYEMLDHGEYLIAFEEVFKGQDGFINKLKAFTKLMKDSILFGKYKIGDDKSGLNIEYIKQKRNSFLQTMASNEREAFLKRYGNKFTVEDFIQLHEAKMNAVAAEIRIYTAWFLALGLVGMMGFDEREDDDMFTAFKYNSHEVVRRALLELSFWTSPTSAMQIIRSPFAMMGAISNLTKVAEEFVVETSYLLRGERDPKKRTYPGYYLLKNTPIVNRFDHVYQMFEPYQRPKTTVEKVFWDIFKD